jgi:hypothetical protein
LDAEPPITHHPGELLYGVPEAHFVNAAFSHSGPHGGRFNNPGRGAWYAGVEVETSIAEVPFIEDAFFKMHESVAITRLTMSTFWLISPVPSTILMFLNAMIVCNRRPSLSAMAPRKRWLVRYCTKVPMGLCIPVSGARLGPASRASGRRLFSTLAAIGNIESRWKLKRIAVPARSSNLQHYPKWRKRDFLCPHPIKACWQLFSIPGIATTPFS